MATAMNMTTVLNMTSPCLTPGCVDVATYLLNSMSPNFEHLDPCVDWDEYVCGGYRANHHVDAADQEVSFSTIATSNIVQVVSASLEKEYKAADGSPEERERAKQHEMIRKYSLACLDWHGQIQEGLWTPDQLFHHYIKGFHLYKERAKEGKAKREAIKRGSPVDLGPTPAQQFNKKNLDLMALITRKSAVVDVWLFVKYEPVVAGDGKKVAVSPALNVGLMTPENYKNTEKVNEYKGYLEQHLSRFILHNYQKGSDYEFMHDLPEAIFELEKRMVQALPPLNEREEAWANPTEMTLEELKEIAPRLALDQVIRGHPDRHDRVGWSAPNIKTVLVVHKDYLERLSEILQDYDMVTVLAFMQWQVWRQFYLLWESRYLEVFHVFMDELNGNAGQSREEMCLKRAKMHITPLVDATYIQKKWSPFLEEVSTDMVKRIQYEHSEALVESPWIDETSKVGLLRHARDLRISLGYSREDPDVSNPLSIRDFYGAKFGIKRSEAWPTYYMGQGTVRGSFTKDRFVLWWDGRALDDINQMGGRRKSTIPWSDRIYLDPESIEGNQEAHSHIQDYFKLAKKIFYQNWQTLSSETPERRKLWQSSAIDINPHYSDERNHLVIPAGVWSYPVLTPEQPSYVAYGLAGTAIGHGLTSAYEGVFHGRHTPELIEQGKWTQKAADTFDDSMLCLRKKYNGATITASDGSKMNANLNGTEAVNQLIADIFGTQAAYDAFEMLQMEIKDAPLPGLQEFTPEQMFFLFSSTRQCSNNGAVNLAKLTALKSLPPQLRTWVPVMESQGWRDAFKCQIKEPVCPLYGKSAS